MQEENKDLICKGFKVITAICLSLFVSVTIIACVTVTSMYKQSLKVLEQDVEKWRIYFETDYDCIEYPNIDMSQRIGDDN